MEYGEFGQILCENFWESPDHLHESFLKEGNRLIEHFEGNKLLGASSEENGASKLERIMSALHENYLGKFISGLIKKQPEVDGVSKLEKIISALHENYLSKIIRGLIKKQSEVLSDPAYFQVLISRLGEVSDTDLPLIFKLMDKSLRQEHLRKKNRSHIFNMLAEKISDFPESKKRGLFLIGLASIIWNVTWEDERFTRAQWLVAQIGVPTDDANAISIHAQCLEKVILHHHFSLYGEEKDTAFLEFIKSNLHHIPDNQVGEVLGRLTRNANDLESGDLQLQVLDLLESYLSHIPDSQIKLILEGLAHSNHFKLKTQESRAFNLIKDYLPSVPSDQVGILYGLAQNIRYLSEDLRQDAFYFLKSNSDYISDNEIKPILVGLTKGMKMLGPESLQLQFWNLLESKLHTIDNSQIGEILQEMLSSIKYLPSEEMWRNAFNFIERNLKQTFENQFKQTLLTEEQLLRVFENLSYFSFFRFNNDAFNRFVEKIKPNIFSLLEEGISCLSTKNISYILDYFFSLNLGTLRNKEEQLPVIFSIIEKYIDRLPESESERVLLTAAKSLWKSSPAGLSPKIKYHFLALLQKRLGGVSGVSLQRLLSALAKSLRNLDEETRAHAKAVLISDPANITDPSVLKSKSYSDYKAAVDSYSLHAHPSTFRKVMEFFLSSFKMAWSFFTSLFRFA